MELDSINTIRSDKTWDMVLDICLAAKSKYIDKISRTTGTLTLKFDDFIAHVTTDPIERKSWYSFIISTRSKKINRQAINMSYLFRAKEITFNCNLLTEDNVSKRRKANDNKCEDEDNNCPDVAILIDLGNGKYEPDESGKGFGDNKRYSKKLAAGVFQSVLKLVKGNESRERTGTKQIEVITVKI